VLGEVLSPLDLDDPQIQIHVAGPLESPPSSGSLLGIGRLDRRGWRLDFGGGKGRFYSIEVCAMSEKRMEKKKVNEQRVLLTSNFLLLFEMELS
jgi:hypothetical protein